MARYTKVLKSLAHNAVGSRRIETVSTSGSSITSLTYVPGSYHYVAAQSNGTNITGNSQNLFGNQIKLSGSSAGGVQLYEATSNGSNYLQLNAPAAITSNFVLTLPNGPPSTSGYALVSTDAGVLSWSAFSGGNTYITGLAYAPSTQKITATLSDSSTVVQSPSLEEFGDSISIKGTNEGHVNLYEKAVNGSAYVSLRAPVDMGTNPSYIISLPVADGATGQVMARGSGGQLTWVNNDDANYYVTGGTYDSSNDEIDFSGNTGFPAFSVDTSAFAKGSIAGASTYVPYFTAASALTGTNTFRWDNANGFLTLSNATASTATHTGHPLLVLENTNADAYPAGIKLYKNSASSAANDLIGLIRFYANDNAGTPAEEEYARIEGEVESSTAGAEVGKLSFYTVNNGSFARRLWMSGATTTINSNTEITGTLSTTGVATLGNNSVTNTQSAGNDSTRIATTAFVSTAVDNAVASSTQYYNTFYNSSQGLVGSARLQTDASNNIILSGTSNIAKTAADFQSTLGVSGALTVSGNSSLKGTLGVASTTTLSGATTIEAATDIIGNLTIKDGGYATPMWKMTATQGAGKVAMIDSGSNASTPQFFPILQLHNEAQDVDPGGGGAVVYADMPTIHFRKLGPRNAVNSANTTAGFRFLASGLSTAAATTTQKQFLVYTYQPDESSGTPAEIAKLDSTGIFTATTFAGELSGTIDSATTATTQSASNNSTKVATTAYVDAAVSAGGGGGISFNGSTANGLVTYGNASTADVEANLTFDGSDLSIAASGKLKVVNASSDYWSIYNQSNGKMRIDQGTTQRVLASSGEFQFANDIIVDNDLLIGSTATVNGARLHVQGEENLLANFFSTDGIGEIRIGDNYNTGHKYTRILSVGSQLKLMPDDGAEMMNLDGSAYKTTLLGETGGNSPKLMFDNPDASNDIQLTQADSGWFGLSTDGGSNQHFVARTGNIGIGTESPTNLLTVSGNASPMRLYGTSTGKVEFDVSTTGDYTIDADDDIRLDAGGQDIVLFGAGSEFGRLTNSSQDFIIENTQSDKDIIFKAKKSSTSTEIMRIDGSVSRVGIGTAAPAQTLDVRGTTLLSGATDAVPFEVFAYGAGTSAMHITSGSATGLGTATPLGKLHINAGAYQMVFQRDTHHHTIVKGNSDDTLIFATGAPGSHTTRFKIMPTGIDVVNNAMITGTLTTTGVATLGNNSVTNTQSSGDNSTRIATTEFVTAALAAGGYGNVTKVGTPANNQIGVWTGDGTIEGANTFAWDNSTLTMTNTGDTAITLLGDANRSGENSHAMAMRGKWDGTVIGTMMIMTGPDTTNKDDGQLAFYTASAGTQAERMRIDETGNIGIGTTAPANALTVHKAIANDFVTELKNTHATAGQSWGLQVCAGTNSSDAALAVENEAEDTSLFYVRGDGNVGIGTTSPGEKLDVRGKILIDQYLRLQRNTSTNGLNLTDSGGNAVPCHAKGLFAGDGFNLQPGASEVLLYKSTTGSTSATAGKVRFASRNDAATSMDFAHIEGIAYDDTASGEDGNIQFVAKSGGSDVGMMELGYDGNSFGMNLFTGSTKTAGLNQINTPDNTNFYLSFGSDLSYSSGGTVHPPMITRSGNPDPNSGGGDAQLFIQSQDDLILMSGHYSNNASGNDMVFKTGGTAKQPSTERMRMLGSNGNIGIGTGSPTQVLDVITGDGVVIRRENTDSAIYGPSLYIDRKRATGGDLSSGDLIGNITFRPFETDYDNRAATISAAIEGTVTTDTTPGRLMFSTAAAGANTVTERMRIDSTGNVGIGTTTPSMPLHVVHDDHEVAEFESSHSAGASIKIDATSTGGTHWKLQSTANGSGHGGGKLSIQEAGTNRVAIAGGGNVGIGTTTPGEKLHVVGTSRVTGKAAFGGSTLPTNNGISVVDTIQLQEKGSSPTATTAWGTVWVSGSTPNKLYFTDDAGTAHDLTAGGGGTIGGTVSSGYIPVASSTDTLSNGVLFTSGATESMYIGATPGTLNAANYNTTLGYQAGDDITEGDENTLIGQGAGANITTGDANTFIGRATGFSAIAQTNNTVVGSQAGQNLGSSYNTMVGAFAGYNTAALGSYNSFFGFGAGQNIQGAASKNIAIGLYAHYSDTDAAASTIDNIAIGTEAMKEISTGYQNVGIGKEALLNLKGGYDNTVVGVQAGATLTTGYYNTYIGKAAGSGATSAAHSNVGIGLSALSSAHGANNVAIGRGALSNTTDANQVAIGSSALEANTSGEKNVAIGFQALEVNTTGSYNVAMGHEAMELNVGGYYNVAIGYEALATLAPNSTEGYNTALGYSAGTLLTTGTFNTLLGASAGDSLTTAQRNTMVGHRAGQALTTQSYNTMVGERSGENSSDGIYNTFVGYLAGYNNAHATGRNTFIGSNAGQSANSQYQSVFIGQEAGYGSSSSGYSNVVVGRQAGYSMTSALANVWIGHTAGYAATTADKSVFIGESAGKAVTTQDGAVLIGFEAGRLQEVGSGGSVAIGHQALYSGTQNYQDVAIGYNAGRKATGASASNVYIGTHAGPSTAGAISNKLYINNAEGTPLIYGEFDTQILKVNGGVLKKYTEALYMYDNTGGIYASPAQVTTLGNFCLIKPEVGPGVGSIPVYLPEGTAAMVGFETTVVNDVQNNPANTLTVSVAQGTSNVIYEGSSNTASATVTIGTYKGANKTFLLVDTGIWIVKA